MKHIIVIGDNSSTNLGDPILTQSTKYIIDKLVEKQDCEVSIFDIAGRVFQRTDASLKISPLNISKRYSRREIRFTNMLADFKSIVGWYIREKTDFVNRLERITPAHSNKDHVTFVIAGGALISSSLFYAFRINTIVKLAKRYKNSRIVFNGVGIEKSIHNSGLAKFIVRHYLQQPQVVAFSTRDHIEDVSFITSRNDFRVQLPDSGLFASEAFGIAKKESELIGLSVISYQAYQSIMLNDLRAQEFTPNDLLSFWVTILKGLISNGKRFKILTNGGLKDYEMALRLCEHMNLAVDDYLLPLANEPKMLIQQLSQFKLIIAHRLHALIVSTSLLIPTIPVIWSDKVRAFADMIHNNNCGWPSQQFAKDIIEYLLDSDYEYLNRIDSLKQNVVLFLKNNI